MTRPLDILVTTALVSLSILASPSSAEATEYNPWVEQTNNGVIHDASGVYCPTDLSDYVRGDIKANSEFGYCAYTSASVGTELTVQFYKQSQPSLEAEMKRTLAHFEDRSAVVSVSQSVGCEGNLAAAREGDNLISDLAMTVNDYEVDDDLRCLVLETDDSLWVISTQSTGDWYVSTINSLPLDSQPDASHMVEVSARFHAAQFTGPSV